MRDKSQIINDIRSLVLKKGFIYALCMLLFQDFHFDPEELHEVNHWEKLSFNEAALLLGFLIQNEINLEEPESPLDLYPLKQRTYELLKELHGSLNEPARKRIIDLMQKRANTASDPQADQGKKEFFGSSELMMEPIFYSGSGIYDFQYLEYLDKKYKYDKEWLMKRHQDLSVIPIFIKQIKAVHMTMAQRVHLRNIDDEVKKAVLKVQRKHPGKNIAADAAEMVPALELHQYVDLFTDDIRENEEPGSDEFRHRRATSFYKGLIDLFTIKPSDLKPEVEGLKFLETFSIVPGPGKNTSFGDIGAFNQVNSHPIIKLDNERYFVPLMFTVCEAAYESPYYWMMSDPAYKDIAAANRGIASANIVFELLVKVFNHERTFKNAKIIRGNGETATDVDVLCVLGSKALAVQVKSKKLTILARMGSDIDLKKDFKAAVQDAYNQGIESRTRILGRDSKLVDESGQEIRLSERIDDVYIMAVTTETYPALTHQAHIFLEKQKDSPNPIVLSVFDLELVGHYLADPYEFLYYVRQRIQLMDTVHAGEEMTYLGYHLRHKLWKAPGEDFLSLQGDFAQLIDRNYYPIKAGIKVSDKGDAIKAAWKSPDFDKLCSQIKKLKDERVTDIIFNLLELSSKARELVVANILATRKKTLSDGKPHDFSMPPGETCQPRLGITYVSIPTNDYDSLRRRLVSLARARKYRSKGDVWIGFGSVAKSDLLIDVVAFNSTPWTDDPKERLFSEGYFGHSQGRVMRFGQKIGRNDPCTCGSRIKFKKCCGK